VDVGGRKTIGQMATGGSRTAVVPCRKQGLQRKLSLLAPKAAFLIRLQPRLGSSQLCPNISPRVASLGRLIALQMPRVIPTRTILLAPSHRGRERHLSMTGSRKQAKRLANELPTALAGTAKLSPSCPTPARFDKARPEISTMDPVWDHLNAQKFYQLLRRYRGFLIKLTTDSFLVTRWIDLVVLSARSAVCAA